MNLSTTEKLVTLLVSCLLCCLLFLLETSEQELAYHVILVILGADCVLTHSCLLPLFRLIFFPALSASAFFFCPHEALSCQFVRCSVFRAKRRRVCMDISAWDNL